MKLLNKICESLVCGIFLMVFLIGCASQPKTSNFPSDPRLESEKDWRVDPKNPPLVELQGLQEGTHFEGRPKIEVGYQVKNFPLSWGRKLGVFLNGQKLLESLEKSGKVLVEQGANDGLNCLSFALLGADGFLLKNNEAHHHIFFSIKERPKPEDLKSSFVLLNQPRGIYKGDDRLKIAFDYVVKSKPTLPTIQYTLIGTVREITGQPPFYFENLKSQLHQIRIWETDRNGKAVGGVFSELNYEFLVE